MDTREQTSDFWEALRVYIDRQQSGIWTALPMIVNVWNYPAKQQSTVNANPAILGKKFDINTGKFIDEPLPLISDIPVHYPGAGGYVFTHPIKQGDEGIGIFSARAIDGWWQNGGQQPRNTGRMHDLSDCMFIPGLRSQKNILPNINQTSPQLRTEDGTSYWQFDKDNGFIIQFPAGKQFRVDKNANVFTTGNITAGKATSDEITLQQHIHAQGNDSNGDTEVPTNAPTPGH